MPLPLIALVIAGAAKGAVMLKAAAAAKAGLPIMGKVLAMKGAGPLVASKVSAIGVPKTLALLTVTTVAAGAVKLVYDDAARLYGDLERDDLEAAFVSAGSLAGRIASAGGIISASDTLDMFVQERSEDPGLLAVLRDEVAELLRQLKEWLTSNGGNAA